MQYTVREIRREDIDRIRDGRPGHEAFTALFPEWRRYFLDLMESPDAYDGYSVELETGDLLGIGMVVFTPVAPDVGVMCVYATDLFERYPLVVVKAAREIVARVMERNRPRCLVAYAHRSETKIPRWMKAFGFDPVPRPPDVPAALHELDFYQKRCITHG